MARILSDADMEALVNDVEAMPEEELRKIAAQVAEREKIDRDRRAKYNANKSPEAYAKQRQRQAEARVRRKEIIKRAQALGLVDKDLNVIEG